MVIIMRFYCFYGIMRICVTLVMRLMRVRSDI